MKKYLKLKGNSRGFTDLEVEVYYDLGSDGLCSRERGYYLRVLPVKRDGVWLSFEAYSGLSMLLKIVKRKSNKALEEAERIAEDKEMLLVSYICNKNGLELEV